MRRSYTVVLLFGVILIASGFVIIRPESFFTKGNTINYVWTYASGSKRTHTTEIESISVSKGTSAILARSTMFDESGKTLLSYRYRFYCDSVNWCIDPLNYMAIPYSLTSGESEELDSDSLVFPFSMKVGDTLMPARGRKRYGGQGMASEEIQFTFERTVAGIDTLKLAVGKTPTFRIESHVAVTSIADYGQFGKTVDVDTMMMSEWFTPKYGVVSTARKGKYGTIRTEMQTAK